MADVLITEFTDPACPWAYSAEPFRLHLNWLYGDAIEWRVRMVVLTAVVARRTDGRRRRTRGGRGGQGPGARADARGARARLQARGAGGRRYACPSYEITRVSDGLQVVAPGFQPFLAYEVLLANLLPDVARRTASASVEEALAWAGEPLASKEVAELCGLSVPDAREVLGRVATERHVGADGFWSLT